MILKDFPPHSSLKEFIQCYRIVHFHFAREQEPVLKAYAPRPETCLHFFLRESEFIQLNHGPKKDTRFSIALTGQQTSVINRYLLGKDFLTFNIVFQPAALFRLTGISSFELTDQYLDAESVFSGSIRLVLEQLQAAAGYNQMTTIADRFVQDLVRGARKGEHQLDRISRLMLATGGKASLDWLARESYLSTKQFTRKFNERTGVNPKTYLRIIRFIRAVNMRNAYPDRDWLRIALECDYFDYQHLVRDYKDFTGYRPHEFHLLENNSPEQKLGLASEVYRNRAASLIMA
ncbi:MAG TPA: helix-turn-helix domain-containing protein [Flavisolibacter sp.]|nr:helix-turn-helix domain-containing protein [Flavisolibacter sp.]